MANPKKRLESQLANAKNKRSNAADKAQYELSLNRNKGLKGDALTSGTAYNKAYYELQQADREVKRIEGLIANYKEPVKEKTEEEKIVENIQNIASGKVVETETTTDTTGTTVGSAPSTRDIDKEIIAAPKFLYGKSDPEKKAFADQLNAAGYKVANWRNIEDLVGKYQEALSDNKKRNTSFGINQTLDEFISTKVSEQAGTGGGTRTEIDVTVSSPTQAASTIQSVVRGILNRDASPEEIEKLYKVLNKAERSAGRKAVKVGNRTEYTTDLDRVQFLTEEVKKIKDPKTGKSEFETKRGQKESLASQELMSVARANGITLSQNQINSYANDIRNGKDINVIKNDIRYTAGLGRPDSIKKLLAEGTDLETVYAPYKRTMAALLEVDANSIDLNDTTLQGAITDRELPIYEFRRLLKKDPRWQYTNNAREEVSNKVLRVLQDFGFQG
jgi:hypothetical protein